MNLQLALTLMTVPALTGSLLMAGLVTERALALSDSTVFPSSSASCDAPPTRLDTSIQHGDQGVLIASTKGFNESTAPDFSEAESDAAVTLFGCDCPACIGALRQLRSQPLLNNSNGHCWTSMQRRVSPQILQEVLQDLEAKEAEPR
jgi:hypothetical protein